MRFDRKYNLQLLFGLLSGLIIGTIATFVYNIDWLWLIFVIIGLLIGFGFAEQYDMNDALSQQEVGVKK